MQHTQQHGNRSFLARHQEASTSKLLIGAVSQRALPLHQDSSRREAYASIMQRLSKVGSCSAFILELISTKEMLYGVQDAQMLLCGHDLFQALERANRIP